MGGFFSQIIFLNPWVLAGLGALPLIWYLLRITPPAPKHVVLPTLRFLRDLESDKQTPTHTPWPILLLRMLVAALVIIALAQPVHNPAQSLPYEGAIRIVMDDGWDAAQTWDVQMEAAQEILEKAGRENREIYIATTAPAPGKDAPPESALLSHARAKSLLSALAPKPWPSAYEQTAKALAAQSGNKGVYSFWFASGIEHEGFSDLVKILQAQGGLSYYSPAPEDLPLALKRPDKGGYEAEIALVSANTTPPGRSVTLHALNAAGQVLDQTRIDIETERHTQTVTFDMPETLRNQIAQYKIAGQSGTGGVFVLDESLEKKDVGLYGAADQSDTKPFIEAQYYIQRALEPFANLRLGQIEDLIRQGVSAIILSDVASLPPATLDALEDWVKDGGLLIRFAGPNMAQAGANAFLTPVQLELGDRSLDGSLTWENPAKLSRFEASSPLSGIAVHEDILVRRQILATPNEFLDDHTWARLEDGTPLITADTLDQGLIVMIHTTASPDWSDLPLSGIFVDILKRTIALAGNSRIAATSGDGSLQPLWVFDGWARRTSPDGSVSPLSAADAETAPANSSHPPGLYGRAGFHKAINIGTHVKYLRAPDFTGSGVTAQVYGTEYERNLLPYLLYAALALLLADWLIMIVLAMAIRPRRRYARAAAMLALCLLSAQPAMAQNKADYDTEMKYAEGLYLAFISSGDPAADDITRRGLENLSAILTTRTSVEPHGVAQLNPEDDELVFFPLIYWPISDRPMALSSRAIQNIQNYLDHGGTILFDTRDHRRGSTYHETQNAVNLRQMTGSLNIPALEPIPDGHVLSKSFYLLDGYPGLHSDGALWVESQSAGGRDGVSSVIIGSNDWAGAWASAQPQRSVMSGGARQQEMAYRFGVNVMMYALTGNYKADQVHVPYILERLGQ